MNVFKILLITLSLLAIVAATAVVISYSYYNSEINKPIAVDGSELYLSIERGMGVNAIADYLKDEGIISNPLILKAYLYLNSDKHIEAGYYRIPSADLNLVKLVDSLQDGSFERKLTFIEGWRVEEYVDYLKEQMGDEFAGTFASSPKLQEGYMFPDTYIIEEGYHPEDLASWMRNTFDKRVTADMRAQAQARDLTLDEVINIASILEREMNIKRDRPIVAGILIKRWKNDWALQADATVQYAKGNEADWWPVVTRNDLRSIESPYNTYLNKGLPPAPISNPSLDAIQAVINYEETPYWFYITGSDGVTHYAETLEQHNINVGRYL